VYAVGGVTDTKVVFAGVEVNRTRDVALPYVTFAGPLLVTVNA
jgi:hypothetical protein